MTNLIYVIDEFQSVYGFCPCCGEIFRLADAKLKFPSVAIKNDPFFNVKLREARVARQQEQLSRYEEKMNEAYERAKNAAQVRGRKLAKQRLKRIDPIFSGREIDTQDVKTIFDPVNFVVFDKMNSESGIIKGIEFIAIQPHSQKREQVLKSIQKVIDRGYLEFNTIRVGKEGEIAVE